ncbi:MAG: hypothetical protein U1F77_08195 [Kiritimatiellia bacterium]
MEVKISPNEAAGLVEPAARHLEPGRQEGPAPAWPRLARQTPAVTLGLGDPGHDGEWAASSPASSKPATWSTSTPPLRSANCSASTTA